MASPENSPHGRFSALISDALRDQLVVVRAESVSLHVVDLPVRSARQRLEALPFALEEQVGRSLDQTHFALCGTNAQGGIIAAVLDAEIVDAMMAGTASKPLVAEQMLLPPPDALEDGAPVWRVYRAGDLALVRVSDGTGFAVSNEMLPRVWQLAGKPPVQSYGAALPSAMVWADHSDQPLAMITSVETVDLRQGIYQPARGFARPFKLLAACAAFAMIAHLAIAAADVRAQRAIADDLRIRASAALATVLPDASVDDPPALVQRRLVAVNQPQRGSGFLPIMDRVSNAMVVQPATVQFRQLSWTEEGLRLTVEAANLDGLQKTEANLAAAGLQVTSGSATADDGAARVEMTVRP